MAYFGSPCVDTGWFIAGGVEVASAAPAHLAIDVILYHGGRVASLGKGGQNERTQDPDVSFAQMFGDEEIWVGVRCS